MIERLNFIARKISFLHIPAAILCLVSFIAMMGIIFSPKTLSGDRFLIPAYLVLLWSLSTYSFVTAFLSIPGKSVGSPGFIKRLKHGFLRVWYGLVGILFLCATAAVLLLSVRMMLLWSRG
ncbi:MAG: hypothetical protein GY703_24160 [Gammaproteobacteria bacterium]|nr:hypothetical protein [Gammaproteobacteria bacterium]